MKPIAIDDFCAVRSLANVTFSPEGTSACFTVSQAKKSFKRRPRPRADRRRQGILVLLLG